MAKEQTEKENQEKAKEQQEKAEVKKEKEIKPILIAQKTMQKTETHKQAKNIEKQKPKTTAICTTGKRKKAIARAVLNNGKGAVRINSQKLEHFSNLLARMQISEALLLAGDTAKKVNIFVNVRGGGWQAQSEAVRLAIGKALEKYNPALKKTFLDYDRQLLVADVRRNEPHKPNDSKPRAARQKSYR